MALSGRIVRTFVASVVLMLNMEAAAQVLHLISEFTGRSFSGTVQVSWPVVFRNCTFKTDSVLISHSYGVLLTGCRIECSNPALYLAGSGSGVIMDDCEVTGPDYIKPALIPSATDRTYLAGLILNGHECSADEEQENIIDMDGLELADAVHDVAAGKKTEKPLFMTIWSDHSSLKCGDSAVVSVSGLSEDMFIGWHSADTALTLKVRDNPLRCTVFVNGPSQDEHKALVRAFTDYGLEAAVEIRIGSDKQEKSKR